MTPRCHLNLLLFDDLPDNYMRYMTGISKKAQGPLNLYKAYVHMEQAGFWYCVFSHTKTFSFCNER